MISVWALHIALQKERYRIQRTDFATDFTKGMIAGLNLATVMLNALYQKTKQQKRRVA
jgi:hypothetical protein